MTVTLVGLQELERSPAHRLGRVAGRLPLPGSTAEVALDQGLSTSLTGGFGSPIQLGQKIQLITSTGPDLFTVVGFTSGTSGGPSFTHDAVFVDDAAMLGPFGLGLHTPLVALRFGPGATVAAVSSAIRARFGAIGDHLRSAFERRSAAPGAGTTAGARDRPEPDRGRRRDREQRGARRLRAPAGDRPAPCSGSVIAAGVPALRCRGGHDRHRGCPGRGRCRPRARGHLQQQPRPG